MQERAPVRKISYAHGAFPSGALAPAPVQPIIGPGRVAFATPLRLGKMFPIGSLGPRGSKSWSEMARW